MESKSYYSKRVNCIILSILCWVLIFLICTKVLNDPDMITDTAVIILRIVIVVLVVVGLTTFIKAVDKRPIVTISKEGIEIQSFIFSNIFIKWDELKGINREKYTQLVASSSLVGFSTNYMLRFHRKQGRSVAVNLSLLDTQNNDFFKTLGDYIKMYKNA
ncbi:hypothetical protein CPAST_c06380 [Clostridium pasteurianum DSM 525 = ATCC 6013]|jgi:hypothetical protein|uniref:Uncharacterized protein n=1 Tax=Clostridium pasteurianum DSM 525 = ATCC 6013 TaxID=1262449 RepID=A0A0H3J498_CLOPA|nr:hypothetical protein [Clostridium pasteurianum]AJA46738.1 hypothetical protein CPAST_c06380 [Clostridium pasteurianum DSM 525 = ATCC 6013]AJA50726.1 hypothetical protein CLPA_c06380 [Clostridium pasteurianum DSM 525 = ATCC 6013]AOZ74137.1 hypothetical protein AQ983_03065 [Clostridium pasteurianum DSM 525 = ATCC 6013]AOZ77934.1 hypothetical protein AQ984_03065 [Clostridium pasteurianum]ELP61304.1 hypothetical protein F502_02575 [Clostridium pasteurianum DSM 525 = ATCC 6013]